MVKYAVDIEAWFIIEAASEEVVWKRMMEWLNKQLSEKAVEEVIMFPKSGDNFEWEIKNVERER